MTNYVKALTEGGVYQAEAARTAEKLRTAATISDGIIRWNSNNAVPPAECVALAAHIGLPVNVTRCTETRDRETTSFLADYRKRPRRDSLEARFERRAAFGKGHAVVDIISGHHYRT
jgi:hypothetical protein